MDMYLSKLKKVPELTCFPILLMYMIYVIICNYIYIYIYTHTSGSHVCLSVCLCWRFLASLSECRAWSGLCRSPPQRLLMAQDSSWAQHRKYMGDLHQNTWEIIGKYVRRSWLLITKMCLDMCLSRKCRSPIISNDIASAAVRNLQTHPGMVVSENATYMASICTFWQFNIAMVYQQVYRYNRSKSNN